MELTNRLPYFFFASFALMGALAVPSRASSQSQPQQDPTADFRASARCLVCHNNLKTASGQDVSIGKEWRAGTMANSARDPYWQGSVRREVLEHPESSVAIQTECASCHMPLQFLQDKEQGHPTEVFKHLPLQPDHADDASAADGVSCTVCHQIQSKGLGTPASYSGNFEVAPAGTNPRPVFGPFAEDPDRITKVHEVSAGYAPVQSDHIRAAGLCGGCHTLYTATRGPDGKQIGQLPEQMPYLEWLHSDYRDKQTCQQCHMPAVEGSVAVSSLLGQPRDGVRRHGFLGANFLMESMLDAHRDELGVTAQSAELAAAAASSTAFLQSQSAHVTLDGIKAARGELSFAVHVENLTGHKLPTAFPSRRAWQHVVVSAPYGQVIFESGKLNPDGSIAGNANDADATRYSPHYARITTPDQVEIFEPILGDSQGHVTTGLLSATQYLKDNRILPTGFDKKSASADIAVHGEAADDAGFTAGQSTTQYAVAAKGAKGPFSISVELLYQPVGYRWAHNLGSYAADEPKNFVKYYEQAAAHSSVVLAHAEAPVNP